MNYTNYLDGFAEDGQIILSTYKKFQLIWFGGNFVIIKLSDVMHVTFEPPPNSNSPVSLTVSSIIKAS